MKQYFICVTYWFWDEEDPDPDISIYEDLESIPTYQYDEQLVIPVYAKDICEAYRAFKKIAKHD